MIQELPKSAEWIASAGAAFLRGDPADALRCYERATEGDPESADAHAGRSLALVCLGRPGDAQRAALQAVAITPTHLVALNVLARATFIQKDFRRARQYCRCVFELDPADEEALAIEAEIQSVLSPHGVFDTYISLGFNCEAGLQFARIGCDESSFFRYTVAHFDEMFRLIESDFAGVFLKENLRPLTHDLVTDQATGLSFHSELSYETDPVSCQKTFIPSQRWDEIYQKEAGKVGYLTEKWRRLASSGARTLYFLKYDGLNVRERIGALRDLFSRRYPQHDFTILVLQTENRREDDWQMNRVINRYLPRFAPLENVHDADRGAWDLLFEEFPLRKQLTR